MTQYTPETIKPLVGKAIQRALLNNGDVTIWFDDGTSVLCTVEGDCCSTSTYYDIVFEGDWQTPLVDVIEHAENNDNDVFVARRIWNCDGDSLSLWNVVFKTAKGAVILKHINNSNGYYNGNTSYQIIDAPLKSVLCNN